ncbi:hypothetical protein E2320_021088, partial [Naja naja]
VYCFILFITEAFLIATPFYGEIIKNVYLYGKVKLVYAYLDSQVTGSCTRPFQLTVDKLKKGLQDAQSEGIKVKGLILLNPQNPLGDIYSLSEMQDFLEFAKRHELHVIVDEIYMLSVFDDSATFHSVLEMDRLPDPQRTHVLWGISKDFAMSGIRFGALYTLNQDVIKAVSCFNYFHGICGPIQYQIAELLRDRGMQKICEVLEEQEREILNEDKDPLCLSESEGTVDSTDEVIFVSHHQEPTSSGSSTLGDLIGLLQQQMRSSDWLQKNTVEQFAQEKPEVYDVFSNLDWINQVYLRTNHERLKAAHTFVTDELKTLGVPFLNRNAGFFVWIDFRKYLRKRTLEEEMLLWKRFLDKKVLLSPGTSFECNEPGWFASLFADKMNRLRLGMQKICEVLEEQEREILNEDKDPLCLSESEGTVDSTDEVIFVSHHQNQLPLGVPLLVI